LEAAKPEKSSFSFLLESLLLYVAKEMSIEMGKAQPIVVVAFLFLLTGTRVSRADDGKVELYKNETPATCTELQDMIKAEGEEYGRIEKKKATVAVDSITYQVYQALENGLMDAAKDQALYWFENCKIL